MFFNVVPSRDTEITDIAFLLLTAEINEPFWKFVFHFGRLIENCKCINN